MRPETGQSYLVIAAIHVVFQDLPTDDRSTIGIVGQEGSTGSTVQEPRAKTVKLQATYSLEGCNATFRDNHFTTLIITINKHFVWESKEKDVPEFLKDIIVGTSASIRYHSLSRGPKVC